jgi:hypothetical protein
VLAAGAMLLALPLGGGGLVVQLLAVIALGLLGIGAYALTLVILRAPERAEVALMLGRVLRRRAS